MRARNLNQGLAFAQYLQLLIPLRSRLIVNWGGPVLAILRPPFHDFHMLLVDLAVLHVVMLVQI